jgi:hypothetical protein
MKIAKFMLGLVLAILMAVLLLAPWLIDESELLWR